MPFKCIPLFPPAAVKMLKSDCGQDGTPSAVSKGKKCPLVTGTAEDKSHTSDAQAEKRKRLPSMFSGAKTGLRGAFDDVPVAISRDMKPVHSPLPKRRGISEGPLTFRADARPAVPALAAKCTASTVLAHPDATGAGRFLCASQCEVDPSAKEVEQEAGYAMGQVQACWKEAGQLAHALAAGFEPHPDPDAQAEHASAWIANLEAAVRADSSAIATSSSNQDALGNTVLSLLLGNAHVTGDSLSLALSAILSAFGSQIHHHVRFAGPGGQTLWHLLALRDMQQRDVDWEVVLTVLDDAVRPKQVPSTIASRQRSSSRTRRGSAVQAKPSVVTVPSESRKPGLLFASVVSADTEDSFGRTALTLVRHRLPDSLVSVSPSASSLRNRLTSWLIDVAGATMRQTALHKAVQERSIVAVKHALGFTHALSTSLSLADGLTPSKPALAADAQHIDVNARDVDGWTAFHLAVHLEASALGAGGISSGMPMYCRLLAVSPVPVDVSLCTNNGTSPLLTACRNGDAQAVALIAAVPGIDVNKPVATSMPGVTAFSSSAFHLPLLVSSEAGHVSCVDVLCRAGADVHAVNEHGESALFLALERDHGEVVRVLLSNGADPRQKDKAGNFPREIVPQYNPIIGTLPLTLRTVASPLDRLMRALERSPLEVRTIGRRFSVAGRADENADAPAALSRTTAGMGRAAKLGAAARAETPILSAFGNAGSSGRL